MRSRSGRAQRAGALACFGLSVRVAWSKRLYLIVYLGLLCAMAILVGKGASSGPVSTYEQARVKVAVVDRDDSVLSRAVAAFTLRGGEAVELADDDLAIQDATARDLASYILMIPAGFGDELARAAASGEEAGGLERVVSYRNNAGALTDERVRAYAQTLYGWLARGVGEARAVALADEAHAGAVQVALVPSERTGLPEDYLVFSRMMEYSLFASSSVFVATGLASLRRSDLRRRLAVSAVPPRALAVQVTLSCAVFGLVIWVIAAVAGLVAFAGSLAGAPVEGVALVLAAQLAFTFVGVGVGVLLWQLGCGEVVANAVGNLAGMVLTVLGGAWMPLDYLGEAVAGVASLTPGFWASRAMDLAAQVGTVPGAAGEALGCVGVCALFALALAAVAPLVGSRTRASRG